MHSKDRATIFLRTEVSWVQVQVEPTSGINKQGN